MPNKDENRRSDLRYCDVLKLWFTKKEWGKSGTKCSVHSQHGKPEHRGLSPEDEAKFRKLAAAFETPNQDAAAVYSAGSKPVHQADIMAPVQKNILQLFLSDARQHKLATEKWLVDQEKVLERSESLLGKQLEAPRALMEWHRKCLPELEQLIKNLEDEIRRQEPDSPLT
jgi:hypothetical protein